MLLRTCKRAEDAPVTGNGVREDTEPGDEKARAVWGEHTSKNRLHIDEVCPRSKRQPAAWNEIPCAHLRHKCDDQSSLAGAPSRMAAPDCDRRYVLLVPWVGSNHDSLYGVDQIIRQTLMESTNRTPWGSLESNRINGLIASGLRPSGRDRASSPLGGSVSPRWITTCRLRSLCS